MTPAANVRIVEHGEGDMRRFYVVAELRLAAPFGTRTIVRAEHRTRRAAAAEAAAVALALLAEVAS